METRGIKDESYHAALEHIRSQCRTHGIDAALSTHVPHTEQPIEFDALLFCDIKGAGQQIAAQAAYPILSLPIGLDPDGMPVSLTVQHTAWREGTIIKWASAIEDLVRHKLGPRQPPNYQDHLAKNCPVHMEYRYPGAPPRFGEPPKG